jgi:hypothetical protein
MKLGRDKYQIVRAHDLGGLYSVLIVTNDMQSRLKEFSSCPVILGVVTSGQATCIRFSIEDTTFSILNAFVYSSGATETLNQLMEFSFKQDRET